MHQRDGRRAPHKPLLALLALGRLLETGTSRLTWDEAEPSLAGLLEEFGTPARTSASQRAAYPFTHLRSDGVWRLSRDVPRDTVGPLRAEAVVGSSTPEIEAELLASPARAYATARALVTSHFPETLLVDVLTAAGLDADVVLAGDGSTTSDRRRSAGWRHAVVQAWDRQCAFCGFDGQVGGATVGLEAAHVRWYSYGGPDTADNGLALCSLHHKLFDRGVLGLDLEHRVRVSEAFTARTDVGRQVYDLSGVPLRPRLGTTLPAAEHVAWHGREVFRGLALAD